MAITGVLINHFVNLFSDDFLGYANGLISIFIILSGYGIFYSLNKKPVRNWKKFFIKRLIRIYPLFFIAMIFYTVFVGTNFTVLQFFFINSPYWFVDAIIYCYLLTPIFFYILEKMTPNKFLAVYVAVCNFLRIIDFFHIRF